MKSTSCLIVPALLFVAFGCGGSDASPSRGSMDHGTAGDGGEGEGGLAESASGADGNEPTTPIGGQAQGGARGDNAGDSGLAGAGAATAAAGAGAGAAGEGGGGDGSTGTPGCKLVSDCDDGIACTVDRCNLNHSCSHSADSSLCAAGPGECQACDAKVGCVSRSTTNVELLLDKDFDQLSGIWKEASVTYGYTIFSSQYADTPDYLVELGPADLDAFEQEHATMSQTFVLPAGTQKLTFSGQYQLSPGGTQLDIEDSTRVALHLGTNASEAYLFNVWLGVEPAIHFWKGFNYEVAAAELKPLLGKKARLEFEANTWDTIFDFDSVSLEATVCPPN